MAITMRMHSLIVERFDDCCKKYPGHIALVTHDRSITYSELQQMVTEYCGILEKVDGSIIGLSADRSIEMHAMMLAVFYSGKTLLPLNSSFPLERTVSMMKKAGPAVIFFSGSDEYWRQLKHTENYQAIYSLERSFLTGKFVSASQPGNNRLTDVAYILYTSGSTGHPKGVPVTYANLEAFLRFFVDGRNYYFNAGDRFLQVYEPTFDVFYFSFLVPLMHGSTCFVMHLGSRRPRYLYILKCLQQYQITVVSMVPTVLQYVRKYLAGLKFPRVRYSFFSGDALHHELALLWQQSIPLGVIHNFYGPAETTIVCTRYCWQPDIAQDDVLHDVVSLGKPFPGMHYLIINERNEEIENSIGELALAGDQVISSYLTAQSPETFFVRETTEGRKVFYKTGDLASVNRNGNIMFHGRKDSQVKINGFRVEAGEIEYHLHQITGSAAIVMHKKGEDGIERLYACFETKPALDEKDINHRLAEKLPAYMLPSRYYSLASFPLNANHKIDRMTIHHEIINLRSDERSNTKKG